jgi:hypothetical protein
MDYHPIVAAEAEDGLTVTCNIAVKTWSERISDGNSVKAIMTGAVTELAIWGRWRKNSSSMMRTAVTDSGRFRGDIFEDLPTRISQSIRAESRLSQGNRGS